MLTNQSPTHQINHSSPSQEASSSHHALLVVDSQRRIVSWNHQLLCLWGIPPDILATLDDKKALACVASKFLDPVTSISEIEEIYTQPELELHDVVPLQGNVYFERYTYPLRLGQLVTGRVWEFFFY